MSSNFLFENGKRVSLGVQDGISWSVFVQLISCMLYMSLLSLCTTPAVKLVRSIVAESLCLCDSVIECPLLCGRGFC